MKQLLLSAALLVIGFSNGQVKIGDNPTTMNPASILELESTTQGFLLPRLTYAQRTAIATPPAGLQIWCTDCGGPGELQLFTGTSWVTSNVVEGSISPIICAQSWATLNLDVTTYSDGTLIPEITDNATWKSLTTGAYCSYNNNPANDAIYGKLYNWYAAAGVYDAASLANPNLRKKLAPVGWHVPSNQEWNTLITCLGGLGFSGGKMKEIGTAHWASPNISATNSSGFTGLPGGSRKNGLFIDIGNNGNWFTGENNSYYFSLSYLNGATIFNYVSAVNTNGFSVRCIRD